MCSITFQVDAFKKITEMLHSFFYFACKNASYIYKLSVDTLINDSLKSLNVYFFHKSSFGLAKSQVSKILL